MSRTDELRGTMTVGGRRVGDECLACWHPVVVFDDYDNRLAAWCACPFPDDEDEMLLDSGTPQHDDEND